MSPISMDSSVTNSANKISSPATSSQAVGTNASSELSEVNHSVDEMTAELPSPEEIRQAAESVSQFLQSKATSLSIVVDNQLDRPIVTVMDSETQEVVRQIPNEDMLALARFVNQYFEAPEARSMAGVLFDSKS